MSQVKGDWAGQMTSRLASPCRNAALTVSAVAWLSVRYSGANPSLMILSASVVRRWSSSSVIVMVNLMWCLLVASGGVEDRRAGWGRVQPPVRRHGLPSFSCFCHHRLECMTTSPAALMTSTAVFPTRSTSRNASARVGYSDGQSSCLPNGSGCRTRNAEPGAAGNSRFASPLIVSWFIGCLLCAQALPSAAVPELCGCCFFVSKHDPT